MKTGTAGIALIKSFEGCRLVAYKPVPTEALYTIGWGRYGVKAGMKITQSEADAMLIEDLAKYEAYVNNTGIKLTQNQFDALVSFTYNCGAGSLQKLVLGRTITQIAAAIPLYNKSNGKVLDGLSRRRAAEVALFNKGADYEMKAADANKIIDDYLRPLYGKANPEGKKEIGRLADELRKASGQKIQNG
jgi:GH24 family phage-related lysozyme (muramidase)